MFKKIAFAWMGIVLAAAAPVAMSAEVVGSIEVGNCPKAITVDEKMDRVFVLNGCEANMLTVISGKERSIIKTIETKGQVDMSMDGNGLAYNPVSDRLYFPSKSSAGGYRQEMYIVDAKSDKTLKKVPNKDGEDAWWTGVHYIGAAKEVLALNWTGSVQIYDQIGRFKRKVNTGVVGRKRYAVTKDGGTIYFAGKGGLSSVNSKNGAVKKITEVSIDTTVPLIDDKTGDIFIGDKGKRKLLKVSNKEVTGSIELEKIYSGAAMALNPNTRHLFVQAGGDFIAVVDADKMEVIDRLEVSGMEGDEVNIAVNKVTNRVYVACLWGKKVVVIKDE